MINITLTGELGSGKSTVANYLISKMNYKIVSAGLIFRQLAAEHNMTAKEFNQFIEANPKYDHYVDDRMAEIGRTEENIIFDSRLAWHFVPKSFKIYMYVDVDTAAERIFNDTGRVSESYPDVETARREIMERRASERLRYMNFYNVDVTDLHNFDLIVDTSVASKDEVNTLIYNSFMAFMENKPFNKIWLSPKNLTINSSSINSDIIKIRKDNEKFVVVEGKNLVEKALREGKGFVEGNF